MKARDEEPRRSCARSRWIRSAVRRDTTVSQRRQRAILTLDGERFSTPRVVSHVSPCGRTGHRSASTWLAYLPPEHAVEGTKLQVST